MAALLTYDNPLDILLLMTVTLSEPYVDYKRSDKRTHSRPFVVTERRVENGEVTGTFVHRFADPKPAVDFSRRPNVQGIFINGVRPKSKKAVKEAVADAPETVSIEATSVFGNEYGGPLANAPAGEIHFVGPDPYTKRNFYGTLTVKPDGTFKVK